MFQRIVFLLAVFLPSIARAHDGHEHSPIDLAQFGAVIGALSGASQLVLTGVAFGLLLLIALAVTVKKPQSEFAKAFLFFLLSAITILSTWVLVDRTLDDVRLSPTGGPVHWHADFRVFNCDEEIDSLDPSGLSNRIGTSEVHEHGDLRIHIEGIISAFTEASLGNFFNVIGGELTNERLVVPTNNGLVVMENGRMCPGGRPGTLQAFLWSTDVSKKPWVASVQKLGSDFPDYVMTPEAIVPPGDCVVFEFVPEKEKTFRTCEQYEAAENRGDLIILWPDLGDDIRN
ncbi:MAG: hypothetical protein HY455_01800 [Parcubacteria group bacterium]|nr:hypothetical protein [Parcubacteria group bacterium]